ncbi:MAG TPA: substrate-binding domain-containing protein, partial [Petrimonas sp.]|nr:substrate-binding domain-containing protein [Petrimonas sp.]
MKQLVIIMMAVLVLYSCGNKSSKNESRKPASKITLTAAGATFPMPYYNMVFSQYTQSTGTQLTYGGIGSGGGIRSLTDKVIDFGATDA